MNYSKLADWISRKLNIPDCLIQVVVIYIIFSMTPMRKHTIVAAARFSNSSKSRFSKFLKNNHDIAICALDDLSKRQVKPFSKALKCLANNSLKWQIAILIDSTFHRRFSLHSQNVQKFNHGKGFVIGHQWTNIVLIINDKLIPLPPIPFYTKRYCRENNIGYKTENDRVVEYIKNLSLDDYVGYHRPEKVVVIADNAYDDQKIERSIVGKKWHFIIALQEGRTIKSEKVFLNSPQWKDWISISAFYKRNRWIGFMPIRVPTNSRKKKRMEFRTRRIIGYLRNFGKAQLICSQYKKKPKGRRKFLACSDLKAKVRDIIIGYRIRWKIEIFHKEVKMFLGFQDVSAKWFNSIVSHVHWVYCAYILMKSHFPGLHEDIESLAEKQMLMKAIVERKELLRINQLLTQINGIQRMKNEIQKALESPLNSKTGNFQGLAMSI